MVAVLLLLPCDHVDKQQALTAAVKVNGLQQLLATATGHGLLGLTDQGLAVKPVDWPFNGRQLSNRRGLRSNIRRREEWQNGPKCANANIAADEHDDGLMCSQLAESIDPAAHIWPGRTEGPIFFFFFTFLLQTAESAAFRLRRVRFTFE